MRFERLLWVVRMRIRSLFRGGALDRELNEELHDHLERSIESNVARGMSPEAARREALLALGGVEQRKEECRDRRKVRFMEDLLQDLRYAGRTLHQAPTFTVAALATLTLGIGASVAMFTVVNGVLLRPLPFPEPDRLFLVAMSPRSPFIRQPMLSDHNYVAFRERDRAFEHIATFSTANGNLTDAGDPAVIKVAGVTSEFFAALSVAAARGRVFGADDGQEGREPTVVLSDRLWTVRFAADETILGRHVTLDGVRRVVIGVMPEGFDFPGRADAWTPRVLKLDPGNSLMFPVVGRLKRDVTVAQARAQFETVARQLPQQPDGNGAGWQIGLLPLKEFVIGDIRRPLLIFAGAVVFVLLIACANVANLLLGRASNRQREIAVRVALGASRGRLIRQLLTESTLLAMAGGACGILLARWAVPALLALAPQGRIPRLEMIRIDLSVIAFAVTASLMTAMIFGVAPAFRMTRRRWTQSLLPSSRTFGARQERLRATLVVVEIALALVLLASAGLMLKSFVRLRAVDLGFDANNVITLNLELPRSTYSSADELHVFHQDLLGRLKALPDVAAAGIVNWRPLGTMHLSGDFIIDGVAHDPGFSVDKTAVSDGYFRAMGISLVRGRDFDSRDAPVAIVSRTVARLIDPTEDAVGKRVTLQSRPRAEDWLTVVGVVQDVKQYGPAHEYRPAIYQPYLQVRRPDFLRHVSYAVRTTSDPLGTIPAIRTALRAVDHDQPATSIVPMEAVLAAATAEPGFHARLLGTFAVLAVMLALVGTYGVLAYSVAQRTHEIGVRVALGARATSIVWMIVRRTLLLSAAGIALGTLGALVGTRLLETSLFETTPTDPATFAAVTGLIFLAALAAGFIPARRAIQVDPLVALRHE